MSGMGFLKEELDNLKKQSRYNPLKILESEFKETN